MARSSAETEYRALARGICEALWIRRILEELNLSFEPTVNMYCDNQAALSIAHNPVHHNRTKHVEIDHHFIKEKIDSGVIKMKHIPTKEQIADILTKVLSSQQFDNRTGKLRMINRQTEND